MEPLHLLAVAAHPDDAELLMGGALAAAAFDGMRAGVIDLAAGESGTRGSASSRAKEAEEAAAILGLVHRENLGLPDGGIEADRESRMRLAERIRALRPDTLLIQHRGGRNPDHHAAADLSRAAAYSAGLARLGSGAPHRPRRILEAVSFQNVPPNLLLDITGVFETKMRAIRAYRSQFEGALEAGDILSNGKDDLFEQITFRCRAYGALVQVPFGEPYRTESPLLVRTLLAVEGRSL
ncbi:MAG: bacillithiol biosynthesis deacetylase BshB1 [Candidatus Eisenbacteria bacterium]|nr:bacillithiol biosynthesis deacetylase BshB1 [Candidatus Eisenbacteria bacterium]